MASLHSSLITTIVSNSIVYIAVLLASIGASPLKSAYLARRAQLISEEQQMRVGGKMFLTSDEKIVSDIFMREKVKLIEGSRLNQTDYMPSLSFFVSKPLMEKTTLFKLIQKMPKGAVLHTHDLSVASLEWVVKNATYRDNVYMCVGQDKFIRFRVYKTPPNNPDCVWKKVSAERAAAPNVDEFDEKLRRNLSMLSTDPQTSYTSNADIWFRFSTYFGQLTNLINYAPIYKDYFWRMLEEIRADNIQYVELRADLVGVYDLDGTVHDAEFGMLILKNVATKFVETYPDFSGFKVIMSASKNSNLSTNLEAVKTAMYLNQKYPDFMMGFDLAGNEDYFHPLVYFIDVLQYPAKNNYRLPYFFHAGETIWQDTSTDYNIVDAILLNSRRIGHGYALSNHPKLVQMVKERDIAMEVSPISNQVLHLVHDLRNHAMASLIAKNIPIVVSSDNYATWEASPLAHDVYATFMDLCGLDADLTILKQLFINSIKYSTMNSSEKSAAMSSWEAKWRNFIQDVINSQ